MDQLLKAEEARSQGYISISDAIKSGLSDKNRVTLYREAVTGVIESCPVLKGSREVLYIKIAALDLKLAPSTERSYKNLLELWIGAMRDGTFRGKVFSEETVFIREWGLKQYWALLELPTSIPELNARNFRTVMSRIPHNSADRQDFYSKKMQIYKAVTGFMKFLVSEGYKTAAQREEFREWVPKPTYDPNKKLIEDYEIDEAIALNRKWIPSRSTHDILTTDLMFHLFGYAGLRRAEVIPLKRKDILFRDKVIKVFGKGNKERFVTPHPRIWKCLEDWFALFPNEPANALLVTTAEGKPYTKRAISFKFERFSKAHNKEISPHALRRGFAVLMANLGMPLNQIQIILGHVHISTTMGYVMTNYKHSQKWIEDNLGTARSLLAEVEKKEQIVSDTDLLERMLG